MQETNISSTAYDDAYRTMLEKCSSLILPVLHELFQDGFTGNEKVILTQNELFITSPNEKTVERITDSGILVQSDNIEKRYHIECQSEADNTILFRLFEYDSQIALDQGTCIDNQLTVEFPRSALIYLRSNAHTPDEMNLEIKAPNGSSVKYSVPVLKIQNYSLKELFDKELLFLLPFYGFCHENELPLAEQKTEARKQLSDSFRLLHLGLEKAVQNGIIGAYEKYEIIHALILVVNKLMANYPKTRKEVTDIMGGKVIESEADRILKRGKQIGAQQMIEKMLRNQKTPEQIAEFCDCDLAEVRAVQQAMLQQV